MPALSQSRVRVSFDQLDSADLQVDAVYQGGRSGNAGDDPFPRLLGVSNMGGFRYRGELSDLKLVLLTSTLSDPDWPDGLDPETGVFTYYGDNKHPGRSLHDTPRKGNDLLRRIFALAHGGITERKRTPPIFVFCSSGDWRDVLFLGLAVPGTSDLNAPEDLVAVWKAVAGQRFQNYRARFTILDTPTVSRAWIRDLQQGKSESEHAPDQWLKWARTGRPQPLAARRSLEYRTKQEQIPTTDDARSLITELFSCFAKRPHAFEYCAAALARLLLPNIASLDVTRPYRDGGRDALGKLRIGRGAASILIDFALEAKCYELNHGVGVREVARLISRLRHRQFGILVTTSYVNLQAYREIKEDQHPIVVICASDIVDILRLSGRSTVPTLREWLSKDFDTEAFVPSTRLLKSPPR